MYLTGQHNVVPEPSLVSNVTHVALAFMPSSAFNVPNASSWPLFTTVEDVRAKFPETTAVMIAIGGWGDTDGFSVAAASEKSRKLFALNVKAMLQRTGADGVDIDWEYPGGNGEDYKTVPNTRKSWEIEAYPKLISEIRNALGPDKLISAAVPGLRRDMIAFTRETVPVLNELLDFFNIMTYDLMNRRDKVTKHHTGLQLSLDGIHTYLENGVLHEKANLGFAFYVKWFKTSSQGGCSVNPVGCKTVLMEDPVTGADLGQTGAFSWHDEIPPALAQSFAKASEHGRYDTKGGGYYYWDQVEDIFWTWDTTDAISKKIPLIVDKSQLGGVFAWGLGEDAPRFDHLRTLTHSLKERSQGLRLQMSDGLTGGLPLSEEHWREEL
ncbi:glycoside hydrolase superfamily [Talaromyces proteolyticus]|uniref:chitinase n=1 Tax=Talaromyces proteolyticus TaxID=1131652 RepID=A0AAD4KY69_9EURO|nr:glycoside hydrolase superfamily [Talaromyces proteolyticus]KAH8699247.1 glycoside hydrolase superfamily [Talaromyces proteolyticus]